MSSDADECRLKGGHPPAGERLSSSAFLRLAETTRQDGLGPHSTHGRDVPPVDRDLISKVDLSPEFALLTPRFLLLFFPSEGRRHEDNAA